MNIKQFTTNSDYGCKVISKEDRNESDEISVLGTYQKPHIDAIKIKIKSWKREPSTKRNILSFVASQFDLLRLISPTSLLLRRFCQKFWERNYKWNKSSKSSLMKEWNKLVEPFEFAQLLIDKQVLPDKNWDLHVFNAKDPFIKMHSYRLNISIKFDNTTNRNKIVGRVFDPNNSKLQYLHNLIVRHVKERSNLAFEK